MSTEPDAAPRSPRWANAFITLFLAAQLLVPLRYYLGDDRFDERFSWRMFSAVRVMQCAAVFTENGAAVPLDRLVHEAWITNVRRGRTRVIEALLERRCAEPGVTETRLENRCRSATGAVLPPQRWTRVCASGEVTEEAAP